MEKIHPSELPKYLEDRILIDVRSPSEYAHAHIPTAQCLPLFNDAERAKVGTAYKQVSPEHALIKGLEFVGPKMAGYVKKMIKWAPNRKVVVHCWRGGKRSGSMAWLLRFAGFDVLTLEGGYKNYRNFVLQEFENQQLSIIVLGGKTGSGKTAILHELAKQGEQIIDLEGIAHHKGSAFGWIGEEKQPSSEQFENDLYTVFSKIDPQKRVWIENESPTIGAVFIPQPFWKQMKNAPLVHLEIPFEQRVKHLIKNYTATEKEDLRHSFQKITSKLGHEAVKTALEALENDDFATAAAIGLKYYDKTYSHNLSINKAPAKHILEVSNFDFSETAKMLINFANNEMQDN
jgi:tRNA 2-selenouridine synthase